MPHFCCVPDCTTPEKGKPKENVKITYHIFAKDSTMRKKWIHAFFLHKLISAVLPWPTYIAQTTHKPPVFTKVLSVTCYIKYWKFKQDVYNLFRSILFFELFSGQCKSFGLWDVATVTMGCRNHQLIILQKLSHFSLSDWFLAIINKSTDNDADVNDRALLSVACFDCKHLGNIAIRQVLNVFIFV
jgi:hypothetical protein